MRQRKTNGAKRFMSDILLENVIQDVDPRIKAQLENDPEKKQFAIDYLRELFQNDNLLSTDVFTTTTNDSPNRQKTLTEEIAELDDQQHKANIELANITNSNRDLIIGISEDLKLINENVTVNIKAQVDQIQSLLNHKDNEVSQNTTNESLAYLTDKDSAILANIDSILDLLELPSLCKICTLQGNYQEALEISLLAKSLKVKFPGVSIFTKINTQINMELQLIIKNLIKLLNTNLKQNNLLKIFNILNQLDLIHSNDDLINPAQSEEKTRFLKLIYLNSRYKYIVNDINNLTPLIKFNKVTYLKRFIETYRTEIYHSISMFFTICQSLGLASNEAEDNLLICQFVKNLSYWLIDQIKLHLPSSSEQDKSQLDGLILQLIYLCKSLAKFHQNFESLITWELCYKQQIISESDWLSNLARVKNLNT